MELSDWKQLMDCQDSLEIGAVSASCMSVLGLTYRKYKELKNINQYFKCIELLTVLVIYTFNTIRK